MIDVKMHFALSSKLTAVIAPVVIGVFVLCALAPALHDCHDDDHETCPICLHAQAPIHLIEVSPPPVLEARQWYLVELPVPRLTCRPLLVFAARAPPPNFCN